MKTAIVGKDLVEISKLVKSLPLKEGRVDFELVTKNPELIITYGGDGTLLHAERKYPGIPKLPLRNSKFCKKCPKHEDKIVLQEFLKGQLKLKTYQKLHTQIFGKDLYALNEFVIRNELAIQAIRFRIYPMISPTVRIGDGIVVSTPFGSTGYFKSITGETFTDGFAIAFNNTTEKEGPVYVDSSASFELVRGKAQLVYDNSPDVYSISPGTKLKFKLSNQVAKIYNAKSMRCPNCEVFRG